MIVCLYILAICLRWTLFGIHTWDYDKHFSIWYDFIHAHGGFAALKYDFSNYNVSYFYLLAIGTYIPLPKIIVIKLIPVCFDALIALFVYLIVRLKYKESYLPIIASLIVLFTPTVFLTSAVWGQFESIYVSLSLGSLYFLLRKQPFWAFVVFGLAVSFKPQAIFLFPLLFVLVITGEIRKRYFLIIPIVYLITVLPVCLIGRGFIDVLTTYRSRTDNGGQLLTLNAPNIFQWLPAGPYYPWESAGIILALSGAGILSFVVLTSRRKITNEIMLKLALVFTLVVPFLLPEVHERYFYLADMIALVYVFYFPKYFYVVILIEISALISYGPYLNGSAAVSLKYITFLVLGVIIIAVLDLIKTLYLTENASSRKIQDLPQEASSVYEASEVTTVRQ
jgi:Gpi18-like mannosyltransferase